MALRQLKQEVLRLFQAKDLATAMKAVAAMPARQVVNPLFGLLYHGDPRVRWYAVAAMGEVVSALADRDMESARVIMRRLMWNLNDESGGIGWGSPEAMGEIMARHGGLAREYASILVSYLDPNGNHLEHEGLQAGLLWAVGRLARIRPDLVEDARELLVIHFTSNNPRLRGMALWASLALRPRPDVGRLLHPLCADPARIAIFQNGELISRRLGDLAAELLPGDME